MHLHKHQEAIALLVPYLKCSLSEWTFLVPTLEEFIRVRKLQRPYEGMVDH